jgi:TP901 family phage tail tape measure protein
LDNNKYQLLVSAKLSEADIKKITTEIQGISKKYSIDLKVNINKNDLSKIQQQIEYARQRMEINLQNARTSFGKYYTEGMSKSVRDVFDTVNANNYKDKLKEVNLQLGKTKANAREVRRENTLALKEADNFMTTLAKDFGKMIAWTIVGTAIFGTIRQIKEGIAYIIEMNKLFTNLQIEMTDTHLVFKNVLNITNEYARAMGTTTEKVMQAVAVFSTYTSTMEEVLQKSKAAIILSNLTGQSIEQTADALMGTMSQFELTAEEAMHVADVIAGAARMLQIDYPKAVQEISEGLRSVGGVAKESKVSIELLSSMIGTLAERTRRSGTEIANALRTIFGRILNVGEDADPDAFKKVEKQFTAIGVAIREIGDPQSLRPVGDILEDLAEKWGTLTDAQRQSIAFDAAGMYRKNIFINLMESYSDVLKNNEAALNSNGVAMEKQEIYAKSLQAKLNEARASWEGFWNAAVNTDAIIWVVNSFTDLMDGLTSVVGVINSVSDLLSGKSNNTLIKSNQELIDSIKEKNKLTEETKSAELGHVEVAKSLTDQLFKLDDITNKSAKDKAVMKKVVSELNKLIPDLNLQFNKETGALNSVKSAVLDNIEVYRQYVLLQASAKKAGEAGVAVLALQEERDKLLAEKKTLEDIKASWEKAKSELSPEEFKERLGNMYLESSQKSIDKYTEALEKNQKALDEENKIIFKYGEALKSLKDEQDDLVESPLPSSVDIDEVANAYNKASDAIEKLGNVLEILKDKTKTSADAVDYLIDNFDSLTEAGIDVQNLLKDTANLEENVTAVIQQQVINRGLAYGQMVNFQQDYANVTGSQWQALYTALVGMYGTDIQNFKGVAQTKAEIDAALIKILGANWATYYKSQAEGIRAAISVVTGQLAKNPSVALGNQLKDLYAMLRVLEGLKNVSAKIKLPSFGGVSGGSSNKPDPTAARIDLENQLLEAIQNRYEKELDLAKEAYETEKAYLEDRIDAVNKLKDAYNEKNEAQNQQDELSKKQRQLNNLMMAGQYGSADYVSLEQEITELKKQMEEDLVNKGFDAEISRIEAVMEANDQAFEDLENKYETILSDTTALWQEVSNIMSTGIASTIAYLKANLDEFLSASSAEQGQMIDEWKKLFGDSGASAGLVSAITAVLKKGSKGEDVKTMQKALNAMGYRSGAIDGIFGDNTRNSLKKFQKAMGVSQTGVLDSATKEKFKLKGYDKGGLADYTGYAMVHGTPQKPEGFLDPYGTKVIGNLMNRFELPKVLSNLANGKGTGDTNIKVIFEGSKFDTPESARKTMRVVEDTMNKIFNDKNRRFGLQNNVITVRP